MSILSAPQRLQIARAVRANERRAERDHAGELNVVPFLDIVMNVLMFVLASSALAFTATITPTVPGFGPGAPVVLPVVNVTPRGYVVAGASATVAPGCAGFAPAGAITVPLRAGAFDAAGLTRCLAALRAAPWSGATFHAPRTLLVGAAGAVPYGELVRALDAARETRPGAGDLYPEVSLGVVR